MTDHRRRHRAHHARVDVGWSRAEQHAGVWLQLGKRDCQIGISCGRICGHHIHLDSPRALARAISLVAALGRTVFQPRSAGNDSAQHYERLRLKMNPARAPTAVVKKHTENKVCGHEPSAIGRTM
jgi:hypothetical protein